MRLRDLRKPWVRLIEPQLDLDWSEEPWCEQPGCEDIAQYVVGGKNGPNEENSLLCGEHARRFSEKTGARMPPRSCREA